MATYDAVRPRKPSHIMTVPPSAFAEDWEHRPTASIAVGLRLLSEEDGQMATREAATSTVQFLHLGEPNAVRPPIDVENDIFLARIMGFAIARAICDPNDIVKMHDGLPGLEDQVFRYFTADGIKLVFQELQIMTAKESPLSPIAGEYEVALVRAHLAAGTLDLLPRAEQLVVLRLLGCALELLHMQAPHVTADDESDGDGIGESDYDLTVHS